LGFPEAPSFEPYAAGVKLAGLARGYDFSFFEYWASDYAGHKQDMDSAVRQLETFDSVLQGLLETWTDQDGLILLTSDHGNMEDLATRKHTDAKVPLLLFGEKSTRDEFKQGVHDLSGVAPAVSRLLKLD
jgi:bisphosphoglycerate-independent phosphoglycerate mutase (AlkP superfamily)